MFIDNHFHSGVPACFFLPPVMNILVNCHDLRVLANILMINVYVGSCLGHILYIKEKLDDCVNFGSLI